MNRGPPRTVLRTRRGSPVDGLTTPGDQSPRPPSPPKDNFVICIEGNIAAGKVTTHFFRHHTFEDCGVFCAVSDVPRVLWSVRTARSQERALISPVKACIAGVRDENSIVVCNGHAGLLSIPTCTPMYWPGCPSGTVI